MSFNLLDIAKGYVTDAVVGKLAGNMGEDSSLVTKALGAALPSLLGGVINSGSSPSGLSSIMNLLGGQDHSMLDNLGGILGDSDKSSGMMSAGSGILSSLLGDKLGGIVGAVSKFSGLGSGSTSSLFSFLAPVLMGVIGKKVSADGLGASGLGDLLSSQKSLVASALPAGLGDMLGLGDSLNAAKSTVSNAANTVSNAANNAVDEAGSFNWKPWLLGLLAIGLGFLLFKQCGNKAQEAVDTTTAAAETVMDSASAVGASATAVVGDAVSKLGASVKRALPGGVELNVPENGIESKLISFISDGGKAIDKTTWFNFDRINFATRSAGLTAESAEQVKNISDILVAFPKVKLKIGGYTDNVGNAASNLKLSANRASTVMKALVANGVDASRLTAEGYGDQHPEASNDTEEGKAQNRRIAVRVTEK
jgi:OmpA-OmpF porin, OOP family